MSGLRLLALLWALTSAPLAAALDHQHSAFSRLLQAHVQWSADGSASTVDYAGLRRDRAALERYLTELSAVTAAEFERWSEAERLAFLINAYNAYTLALIADADPEPESIRDLGSWLRSPWKRRFVVLLGERRSLDDVEHGLIRGAAGFSEPRIHFAVNCASIGCPALRDEAYVAERLDAQLEDQTRRFLGDRSRHRYDAQRRVLYLSKLFDWYGDDFALPFRGGSSRAEFLVGYAEALGLDQRAIADLQAGRLKIDFLDYDWRLNGRRR
jgi:hypothetical protein